MKTKITVFALVLLGGCASVSSNLPSVSSNLPSVSSNLPYDSSQVTIRHGTAATLTTTQAEADKYCSSYGKRAYFRENMINANNAVFDCR